MDDKLLNIEHILKFVKYRLGIMSDKRDDYLEMIIQSLIVELEKVHGISLDTERQDHIMFLVDYTEYRYSNRDNRGMPEHLRWRLRQLYVKAGVEHGKS